jgi:hypothetical protein
MNKYELTRFTKDLQAAVSPRNTDIGLLAQ